MMTQSKLTETRNTASCADTIRVLVVEDHQVLREALLVLLESSDDIVVTDTASNAEEALLKIHAELDLVLLDLSLPGRDGTWLARKIKDELPGLPILVLTMHDQPNFVLKALKSGVDGYLTKSAGKQELLKAIHSVVRNGSYLQSRVSSMVVDALRRRDSTPSVDFSKRERAIARCLVNGFSNPEIARRLSRSVSTVKADLRSLYSKLKVSCRTEAVAAVVQNGLVCRE